MVVSLLAIVGGAIIYSLGGVREKVSQDLSNYEVKTIHDAIRQFKQDTGYYPKQGPFALLANGGAIDPANADHWPPFLASATAVERTKWFNHPANFYQLVLVSSPLQNTGHALAGFNRQTSKGWRGPYLKDGVVRIIVGDAAEFDPVGNAHTPATWTSSTWNPMATPVVNNLVFVCDAFIGETSTIAVRQFGELDGASGLYGTPVTQFGRPYCYFESNASVWLVGMGADRIYQGGSASSDDELTYLVE